MPDPLRNAVIRLAHAKPELQPQLLPLLREASELDPSAQNIAMLAAQFANTAFVKGERWGGGSTTYPRKWYRKLEEYFGPLNAIQLKWFNDMYDHVMEQNEREIELPSPKPPSGLK